MHNNIITAEFDQQGRPVRRILSFVRRQGRLTKGQQQALQQFWPQMGIEFQPQLIAFSELFDREGENILEIGFGMGASLVQMAAESPRQNFLGIEVHLPGVGACLAAAQQAGLTNLRLICHDAVEVLQQMIADNSLDRVQIFFPDPWHKARHHKRRIIQPAFAELLLRKLKIGGRVHLATDWQDYAEQMLMVMNAISGYRNLAADNGYIPRPPSRPLTKFERRGQNLGHNVWDFMFQRIEI